MAESGNATVSKTEVGRKDAGVQILYSPQLLLRWMPKNLKENWKALESLKMVRNFKMEHWNTDEIKRFLESFEQVKEVRVNPPGGDWDGSNLYVEMHNGEPLFICGFIDLQGEVLDKNRWDDFDKCIYIEIRSGRDSRGGLIGVESSNTITAYGKMVEYFTARDFEIINTIDDYV